MYNYLLGFILTVIIISFIIYSFLIAADFRRGSFFLFGLLGDERVEERQRDETVEVFEARLRTEHRRYVFGVSLIFALLILVAAAGIGYSFAKNSGWI